MTSITLRPRRPLEALPLSRYTVDALGLPPSPISIPSKRSLHSSPSRQAESSTSKTRKVSADEGGVETIRRKRSDLTHEAKAALSRDEFGIGKSPARRLFVDSKTSFGISGATLTAPSSPSSPSRRLDFSTTPSNSPGPSRLAPSPPMSSIPTPIEHDNGASVNMHDIGFDIHADSMPSISLGTPDSRPHRIAQVTPATDAALHILSSPVSVTDDNNDQENIPPPQQTPSRSSRTSSASNTRSPLSKSSISGSASSARFHDDASLVHLTGSGRNRIRERSKLNEVHKHVGSDEVDDELTPGRTRPADKGKGKARLSSEVNII